MLSPASLRPQLPAQCQLLALRVAGRKRTVESPGASITVARSAARLAAAPRFMRMIAEMDIAPEYPVSGVGKNGPARAGRGVPSIPASQVALGLGDGPSVGVVRMKPLGEQHQRGQKRRQKRRRADIERDNQGNGHAPLPPGIRLGMGELSIWVQR